MAFKTVNITITSTGVAQQVLVPGTPTGSHVPCREAIIYNDTGNAVVKVGDKNITATNFGFAVQVVVAATMDGIETIGPFSGDAPFNLDEIWLLGTQSNVIRIAYVTH